MITPLPAVQKNTRKIHITYRASAKRADKRRANRAYRRNLSEIERGFVLDPDRWDAEDFAGPSFSNWDID
jgi:hypothetical protein